MRGVWLLLAALAACAAPAAQPWSYADHRELGQNGLFSGPGGEFTVFER